MGSPYRAPDRGGEVVVQSPASMLFPALAGSLGLAGGIALASAGVRQVGVFVGIVLGSGLLAYFGLHRVRVVVDRSSGELRWWHVWGPLATSRGACPLAEVNDVVLVIERVVQGEDGPFDAHAVYVHQRDGTWTRLIGQDQLLEDELEAFAQRLRGALGISVERKLRVRAAGV